MRVIPLLGIVEDGCVGDVNLPRSRTQGIFVYKGETTRIVLCVKGRSGAEYRIDANSSLIMQIMNECDAVVKKITVALTSSNSEVVIDFPANFFNSLPVGRYGYSIKLVEPTETLVLIPLSAFILLEA